MYRYLIPGPEQNILKLLLSVIRSKTLPYIHILESESSKRANNALFSKINIAFFFGPILIYCGAVVIGAAVQ